MHRSADDSDHNRARRQVARAWATGLLVDQTGLVLTWAAAGSAVAYLTGVLLAWLPGATGAVDPIGAVESGLAVLLGGALIGLLRADLRDPARRRSVGVVWDVATFWPRACHPLAPPSYAERAVPELVDRMRLLTGSVAACPADSAGAQILDHDGDDALSPTGRVLLTGYSQGAVIVPAVVALLPAEALGETSLLTLASPARRLHGRAFPAYFGTDQLTLIKESLRLDTGYRWRNLVRRSDYIGSYLFHDPEPDTDPGPDPTDHIDEPAWDPVIVAHDRNQAPPLIHRHSGFWSDDRVPDLARHLMT